MTLSTMVNSVCDQVGIPRPSSVVGNTDPAARQLLALANLEGRDLASRHRWNKLIVEATHTTLAAELQGVMSTIASGFGYLLGDTMWNRSNDRPIRAITPEQWQAYQANGISGPFSRYRIQDGSLYLYPAPAAGETLAFEYISKNWCESSGGSGQTAWTADTDVGVLDEDLMELGLLWRYKKAKGLEYGEDFNQYERLVANAIVRDNPQPHISLTKYRRAGRFVDENSVPDGSWSL